MGAIDTQYTFTATDTITSSKMNNIIDQTTITTDAIIGTTLDVASGKLKVRSSGITSNELAAGSVTSTALAAGSVTSTALAAGSVTSTALVAGSVNQAATSNMLVPSGAVMAFAMNSVPTGWLDADGAAVSRTTYAALFAAIGVLHGVGDGSTTFNVPNLRGIFVRGSGSQTISSTTYVGTFAAKQLDELKSHSHGLSGDFSTGGAGGATTRLADNNTAFSTGVTGGTETRPANIALRYCIKI